MNQVPNKSFVVKGIKALAAFNSANDARAYAKVQNDPAVRVLTSLVDVMQWVDDAKLTDPEVRLMCAAVTIKDHVTMPEAELRAAATVARDADPLIGKRIKNRRSSANYYLMRLDEHVPVTAVAVQPNSQENEMASKKAKAKTTKTAAAPKDKKLSAKDHLRTLFTRKGISATFAEMTLKGKLLASTVKTAVSDLKNKKYAGGDVIVIERMEDETYKRTA